MKVIDTLYKLAQGNNIIINTNEFFRKLTANMTYKELLEGLNSEVEIIEEEKEIPEKINLYTLSNNDSADFTTLQDFNNRDIERAINWILDYLKSKGEISMLKIKDNVDLRILNCDTPKEDKKIKRIQSCGDNLYSEYIGEWLVHKENYSEYDELLMNKINEIIDKINGE
jgi:hypothetical protein